MNDIVQYGEAWSYATLRVKRPIDPRVALRKFDAREKLVAQFPPNDGVGSYVIHDPSMDYLVSGLIGWPNGPNHSCSVRFTSLGEGAFSVSEITIRGEVPDPVMGDPGFWLMTVCISREGKHYASLDMMNAGEKFFRNLDGSEDLGRVASHRFLVNSLQDYRGLIRQDIVKLAFIDVSAFNPLSSEVRLVRPADVPPETMGGFEP